jgi:hypothetical protein
MEPKNIALGIILVIMMSVRGYTASTSTPTSIPTSTPTATQPIPISATVLPEEWCPNGYYCDGSLIPQSEAGVGALVCGRDDMQYRCDRRPNDTPGWFYLNKACEPGMKKGC